MVGDGRLRKVEERDQLTDTDLARVLAEHVYKLKPDGITERLGDGRHMGGLLALYVGVDDRLTARLTGCALGLRSELEIGRHYIDRYRLNLCLSIRRLGDVERPELIRRAAAEALGAFALVFAGCGAIIAEAEHPGTLGTVGVALVFGLVIMAMVYATGHLSGAHLNPAVTVAFVLTRHFPRSEAVAYVVAQIIGAIAAAGLLAVVWPSNPADLGTTLPSVGTGSAFVYEVVLTAFLMFVIVAVATDTRAVGAAAAIAIGGTVGLDALFGGPITGASMNPARSIGPALVSGELHDLWLYIAAPLVGAALGALAYQLVRGAHPGKVAADG